MSENLLNTADAGKILNTTPENVRLLHKKGKLPAIRTASGMRLFTREAVERLAAERKLKAVESESAA